MKKMNIGYLIIASAIIWGLVIVAYSLKLKGTECYQEISLILTGGVITHMVLIWTPLGMKFVKKKNEKPN